MGLESSPFGFDPNEDDYHDCASVFPPILSSSEEYEPKETYRLDEWNWDESLAEEKSDIIRTVNRKCNLITLLGGRSAAVIQLHKSIQSKDLQLAKCLLKRDDLVMDDLVDPLGRNMLHIAASCGNNLAVALAIRNGMDINKTTVYGSTPLMLACSWGHEITCDLLLDFDTCDPTIKDNHGRTALSLASKGLRIHLVKNKKMKFYYHRYHKHKNLLISNILSHSQNNNMSSNDETISSIFGDDMSKEWEYAMQEDENDPNNYSMNSTSTYEELNRKNKRISETFNICLYNTVNTVVEKDKSKADTSNK